MRYPRSFCVALVGLVPFALVLGGLGAVGEAAEGGPRPAPRQGGEALSASADAGRVLDREGGAARRGVLAERWGPLEEGTPLEAGDWLEVATRGANALRVRLAGGGELILGPGTLVEVVDGERIALLRGELEVELATAAEVEVAGPGEAVLRLRERAVLRARDGELERLDQDPRWLVGYESNRSTEAVGSLLVEVDGRNVPLTIGYHKVTVDIRDQIARTVIEESFINHTSSVLEGVFYFPLPEGSSISGFGMWIGNELVQGEIVEKQRAREIYETILRERRDPGLLEWTGGNIFKARVFPIGSEKRIRIAYTQVLPKRGDVYGYSYALESELLRKNPLGRLEIQVNVSSSEPLASVVCSSHETRLRSSEHAATVEFSAEEYSPDRNFELRIETRPGEQSLAVVPHRRGEDGYFMLLVDAPGLPAAGVEARPEADPIDVLVLADTSGSMWGSPQVHQIAFVEALVASLGERDRFNVATCDVETRWAFEGPQGNSLEQRERALRFIEAREPLGWSDLERAFASAVERAGPNTHVVYVGDGIPTSGAADPVALAHELARSYGGSGTFHAVVPGPSSEMVVLRALSGLGGGSVRTIGGGADPAQAAFELLEELAAPAIKDLQLVFEGLPVAAVYPEVLPNLAAGGQQIVVGRFDASAGKLAGRVVVTGVLEGQPVRFETEVVLDGDDEGNSFIPRLWARKHLDHLLDQGSSPEVQARIVTMSEDYQIVTPYTSFLVLESDADRERFGVSKRFRMRDGEEFFTEGRDAARHELLQQQMLAAKTWRARLRAEVLGSLEDLGRGLTELLRSPEPYFAQAVGFGYRGPSDTVPPQYASAKSRGADSRVEGNELREEVFDALEDLGYSDGDESDLALPSVAEESLRQDLGESRERVARKMAAPQSAPAVSSGRYRRLQMGWLGGKGGYDDRYGDPFASLFPDVGAGRPPDPEWTWPEDVVRMLARIDRRAAIASSARAWRFEVETTYTDAREREQTARGLHLIGPGRWLVLDPHVQGQAYGVRWVAGEQRGLMSEGWRLGRVRAAQAADEASWSAPFAWHFGDQVRGYAGYEARVEPLEEGRARVAFWPASDPDSVMALVIEVERGLVLEQVWSSKGEATRGLQFDGFQEVGGVWWPAEVRSWNADGPGQALVRVRVAAPADGEFEQQLGAELARREDALLLGSAAVELADAKQAVRDGGANLDQRWTLLVHFARTQRWDAAGPHLAAIEALVGERPGLALLRAIYLQQSRRTEELRLDLLRTGAVLAAAPREAEHGMATQLLQYAQTLNPGNEVLELLETLHPIFTRQTELLDADLPWDQDWITALARLNRPEQLFEAREAAARKWPRDLGLQLAYASALGRRWELDEALEWLRTVESERGPWQSHELTQLRRTTMGLLWTGYRLEQLVELFEGWERDNEDVLGQDLFDQYLTTLIYLDREEQAGGLIEAWLSLCELAERTPVQEARLNASLRHALGQGQRLYHQRFDEGRAELLAGVARTLALETEDTYLAGRILGHWTFRQTDPGRALLAELFGVVEAQVSQLPAQRVVALVGWLRAPSYRSDEPEAWQPVFEGVFARWLASDEELERTLLASVLLGHAPVELQLRTRRQLLAEAESASQRATAARELYQALLQQPWTAPVQAELVGLIDVLTLQPDQGDPSTGALPAHIDEHVLALHDLVSWILRARTEAIVTGLPEYELMARRTLATERAQALRLVQLETAELVLGLQGSLEPRALRDWAEIEHLYLHIQARDGIEGAWAPALALLEGLVESIESAESAEAGEAGEDRGDIPLRDRVLALRCIATCANLLVRTEESQLAQRIGELRGLLDRLIATENDVLDGRAAVRDLLIALDRGDELEAVLAAWFGSGEEFAKLRWGRDLAHVHAERGRLAAAAEVLEELDRIDELTVEDFRALSGWYTALDQAERARAARVRGYEVLSEDQLASDLQREQRAYRRSGEGIPPELDPEIPVRFIALMRKARSPRNRLGLLRDYYEATQDYRLLECLPAAVLGHSAQEIYEVLHQVGNLAGQIREEAAVDRLQVHLAEQHARAGTDVDRRALRLLQFQIVLRAARQAHGTTDHAERSLRALGETFSTGWEDGELGLMAGFLASHGALQPAALAEEQLRQLGALSRLATDPDERLAIAHHLARLLWGYARHDDAMRELEAALAERRSRAGGRLPGNANEPLRELSGWLVLQGSARRAEGLWLAELEAGFPAQHELWLKEQLYKVWSEAVLRKAEVSLGKGEQLYAQAIERMERDLASRTNENHAGQVVSILRDLWYRAHGELQYDRVAADATSYAFAQLPAVLDLYQYRGGQSMVAQLTDLLEQVSDAQTAFEFLVARAETEPRWLRLANEDFWSQHGWRFGDLRAKVGTPPGALEQRARALVLAELSEDLRTRRSRSRTVYDQRQGHFWEARRADFLETALAFLREHRDSPYAITWATEYLFHGLGAQGEAIAALASARQRGILHWEGRDQLAVYLQQVRRWAESIPVTKELVEERPAVARHRVMLMRGYFHTQDRDSLVRTLGQAEAWFREAEQWFEASIAELAGGCLETELFEDSARLFDEAIALHVRTAPNRGVGDGVLSNYYRQLAGAYSGLGRTAEAVDATAGAIVSWGRNIDQRNQGLVQLVAVLAASPDLMGYLAALDAEVESTGLDNPIVRKALGQVFLGREDPARSAEQLRRALAVQPNDAETHQLLLRAYEDLGRPDLAAAALLEWARMAGHELRLWADLGRRLESPESSERAFTTLVELSPNESEGHQLLAEVREQQERWSEAAASWRHVTRIRTAEPSGYLGLSRALIRQGRQDEAREVLDHLRSTAWPQHFGDVKREAEALLGELESGS